MFKKIISSPIFWLSCTLLMLCVTHILQSTINANYQNQLQQHEKEFVEFQKSAEEAHSKINELIILNNDINAQLIIANQKINELEQRINDYEQFKENMEGLLVLEALPTNIDQSFKSFMDYRTITNRTSTQWQLRQIAYTDEYGLRKIDDYYCVALGQYYGQCGDKFEITTDTGNVFRIIMADAKDNRDTEETNRFHPITETQGNVLEFLVDSNALPTWVYRSGTVGSYDFLSGNIIAIKRVII